MPVDQDEEDTSDEAFAEGEASSKWDSDGLSDTPLAETATGQQRLTEEQIEEITKLLRSGRRLPPHLFPHLFEAPREYQLSYRGKAREADVLSETMAVPLQPVRAFGSDVDGWSNMLVFGDNLQVLRELMKLKAAGLLRNADGTDGFRVCYIDPPFATEREFRGTKGQAAYTDRVAGAEFVESLRRRLILIRELLADDGTLYVHLDGKKGHYVKVVLDELFGSSRFRNEIIWWYYNKMQGNINRFPSNHDSIYVYGKSANPVFNTIMEDRPESTKQIKRAWDPIGKKLVNAKDENGHVIYLEKDDRRVDDVWRLSMLQPADRTERVDFPTQKPETLLSIVIAASSNPGDLVLDAFVGSGTTAVVADQLDRRWVAIDSGKFGIYWSQARLLKGAGSRSGFTLYNAGLYDYKALRTLPRESYVDFVLELFQCRAATEVIRGVTFQGRIGDDPVLVYDFEQLPEATIGREFTEGLAGICGRALGDRCFIIAPASMVEPYEDYLTSGDTKFFFLRIPYSVIAELHKKAFSELLQPTSAASANALIDSTGFDFIQPPSVECDYVREDEELVIQIRSFECEAFAARPTTENIADLAMVLVDHSYDDDEVFRLDSVYFADDLEKKGWQLSFPSAEVGERVMIIYVDLFGNELREVKSVADFRPRGRARKRAPRVKAASKAPRTGKSGASKPAPRRASSVRGSQAVTKKPAQRSPASKSAKQNVKAVSKSVRKASAPLRSTKTRSR